MGQDSRADDLLAYPKRKLILALPAVCIMEAISAFDRKRSDRNKLKQELNWQLKQLQGSTDIAIAQRLTRQLRQANLINDHFLNELFNRLDDYLSKLASRAELIPLSQAIIRRQLKLHRETELDRDGALILASILAHSRNDTTTIKAFLTGNVNDFGDPAITRLLRQSGTTKQFTSTERALQWVNSGLSTRRPS